MARPSRQKTRPHALRRDTPLYCIPNAGNKIWLVLGVTGMLTLCLMVGCSSSPSSTSNADPSGTVTRTDEKIFAGESLEKIYDPHVIMKRAEAFFEKEEYAEALIEYQHFLDLHHDHMLAPYAQFKLGESHFSMAKSVDRDSEPIQQALKAYERLLQTFPGSKYQAEGLEKIQECRTWLAETTILVGEFYYRREAYLAAAHRFELVVRDYPDLQAASEALYHLALTYKELGADDWAREQLVLLARQYPDHKHQKESQNLLASLNAVLPLPRTVETSPVMNGVNGLGQRPRVTAGTGTNRSHPSSPPPLSPPR